MKRFFKRLFGFLICLAVIVTGVGMYIGNRAYEEFYDAPWDQILGIENHSRDVSTIRTVGTGVGIGEPGPGRMRRTGKELARDLY